MNEKSKPKNETIGLTLREAKQKLIELTEERQKVLTEMAPLTPKSALDGIPVRYLERALV